MKIEYYEGLEQEIKRLGKYDDTTILKLLHEKDIKEIERLNNIMNELEDLIVIKLQRDYHEPNYRINTGDLEEIYDKLKELKGDGSNDSKRNV